MNRDRELESRPLFRWEGSKTWARGLLKNYVCSLSNGGENIQLCVEPFAGSASLSLWMLANTSIKHVIISDIDKELINLWTCLVLDATGFYREFREFFVDDDKDWARNLFSENHGVGQVKGRQAALRTLSLLYYSRGGLPRSAGNLCYSARGEDAVVLLKSLEKRMVFLEKNKHRILLRVGCAFSCFSNYSQTPINKHTLWILDPPYQTTKTRRLYEHNDVDTKTLWKTANEVCRYLVGFDIGTEENIALVRELGLEHEVINRRSTFSGKIYPELVIYKR